MTVNSGIRDRRMAEAASGPASGTRVAAPVTPMSAGGTGATTANEAAENLGVPTLAGTNAFTGGNTFSGSTTFANSIEQTGGTTILGDIETAGLADFMGVVNLASGYAMRVSAKTANYPITTADSIINCTSGSFTVTLPTAVGAGGGGGALSAGRLYIIKNSGAGTITLATTGGQTIDGAAPGTIAAGNALTLVSDGANWIIV